MTAKRVYFDTLRSLAFGSISGTYAAIGAVLAHNPRIICFTNNTQGGIVISDDGVNDRLFLPPGSFKLFDLTANMVPHKDDNWVIAIGTQFYVKDATAPVSGAVYIEILYA